MYLKTKRICFYYYHFLVFFSILSNFKCVFFYGHLVYLARKYLKDHFENYNLEFFLFPVRFGQVENIAR